MDVTVAYLKGDDRELGVPSERQRRVGENFTLEAMYRQTDDLYGTCAPRAGATRAVTQAAAAGTAR